MFTTKASIAALAITAGLTFSLAPQHASAQSKGDDPTMPGWVSPDSPVGQLGKANDDLNNGLKKVDEAFKPKPKVTPPPTVTPPAAPEEPGVVQSCINGICSFFHAVGVATGIIDDPEQDKKDHDEALKKAEEELNKAKEAEKVEQKAHEQPKTAPNQAKLNLNTVDHILPKENKKTSPVQSVAPKPTKLDLNAGGKILPKESEKPLIEPMAPKSAKTLEVSRTNTATRIETSRSTVATSHPTINVLRPTINVPHPTVEVHPTINIPHPTITLPTIAHR